MLSPGHAIGNRKICRFISYDFQATPKQFISHRTSHIVTHEGPEGLSYTLVFSSDHCRWSPGYPIYKPQISIIFAAFGVKQIFERYHQIGDFFDH